MTPPGQNYPIHEHGFLFWGIYLGAIVTMTVLLIGLFLFMVQRNGQATRAAQAAATTPSTTPSTTPAGSLEATSSPEVTALAQAETPAPVAPVVAAAPAGDRVTAVGGPHAA